MKKLLYILALVLVSCQENPNIKRLKARALDEECKAKEMESIIKMDESLRMAHRLGMADEWVESLKVFNDTALNCQEAKHKWNIFWDKLHSKTSTK